MEVRRFQITRRQFIQYVAGAAAALGLSETAIMKLSEQIAKANPDLNVKTVWLEGQACGGCSTTALQLRQKRNRAFEVFHGDVAKMGIGSFDDWWPTTDLLGDGLKELDALDALEWDGSSETQVPLQATWARPWDASDPNEGYTSTVDDVLVDILNVRVMRIVGSQAGEQYFNELQQFLISTGSPPPEVPYLLIVNGAVPVSGSGVVGKRACYIASDSTGAGYSGDAITIYDAVREVARGMAVQSNSDSVIRAAIAWGTCSSFGGVPAARNGKYSPGAANEYQSTGASALTTALDSTGVPSGEVFDPLGQGTIVPVLNLAGCCPNPNTLYLVAAHYIVQVLLGSSALGNLLDVDAEGRPKKAAGVNLFRNTIHGLNCPRYEYYTAGVFATKPGDPGCLALLGCRGIFTYAPCYQSDGTTNKQPYWNDQMTACITQGVPCQGCHEKGFPDKMAPIIFY